MSKTFSVGHLINLLILKKYLVYEILFLAVIFVLFIVNSSYLSYPDEFINILAGASINDGKIPYKDFFDHHLPFAWYFAALLLKLAGKSFTIFRTLWAISVFGSLLFLGLWIKRHHKDIYLYYLGFFFLYPLASVYFWFHLYLADSLAVLFFTIIFWLLVVQTITQKINIKIIVLASLLTFFLIFSSLSYLYVALALYIWQAYLIKNRFKSIVIFLGFSILPYFLYALYLMLTNSFNDFYFANFIYNTKLYINIPNYVKGNHFNPLKFGLTLIFNFYTNYLPLITKVKHFDLYLPINVLAGISTLLLLVLLTYRNIVLGALFFFVLSFSAPRSNIQMANETDYQIAVFLVLGMISAFVVLYLIKKTKFLSPLMFDLMRVSQAAVAIFLFFTAIFLFTNTYNKYYLRYTQKMPSINNLSYTASFIDQTLTKEDYFWVGPYEPQESFFVVKAKLPGKYPSLLPQFREDDYLITSFISQFENNLPKLVIYKQEASIFNTPSLEFGKFFLNWMKDKYTSIENIEGITVLNSPSSFNLRTDLHLLNSKKEELLEKMMESGYIK